MHLPLLVPDSCFSSLLPFISHKISEVKKSRRDIYKSRVWDQFVREGDYWFNWLPRQPLPSLNNASFTIQSMCITATESNF